MIMKKILLAAALCALLAGCKTNEANYRQAYEVAKQKFENADTVSTGSHKLERYAQPHVSVVRRYNVVAGRFRQIFNARQMRQRLIASGYGATAILASPMPLYYVVTISTDTVADAVEEIHWLESDTTLRFRAPLPFVLSPR